MPQPPNDPVLVTFFVGMMLLSIAACVNLISMRRKGAVLPYEPRRPVSWGPIGCLLAVLMLVLVGLTALGGDSGKVGEVAKDISTSPTVISPWDLVSGMLVQLLIVLAFLSIVAVFSNATLRDLGIASNRRERVRDMCIGAAACLAALAPVHIVQQFMLHLFFPELKAPGHTIIKMVTAAPNLAMLLLAGVATVVIAPVCEEITFRLLFQGWLERWEDERLGWRRLPIERSTPDGETQVVEQKQLLVDATRTLSEPLPPRRGIAGLSYGWFPIIVSAAVFGLVHYGYGPEPVPIFILGLVLGYVYQRTHRLLPSIVTHALFNLFTMVLLWRMMYHHG